MRIVVLLGAPGSGKGTVAGHLAERLPARHVSSGDLLRAMAQDNNDGRSSGVGTVMTRGDLVADDIVDDLILDQLRKHRAASWLLLDGYPRSLSQAATMPRLAEQVGAEVFRTVLLEAPRDLLIRRLAGRRLCPKCAAGYHVDNIPPRVAEVCDRCGTALVQRADDTPERISKRLDVYERQTAALIDLYAAQDLLSRVDASGDPEATVEAILKAVVS